MFYAESKIQQAIVKFAKLCKIDVFSIPNGADVQASNRIRLTKEGLLPGVPDLFFPIASKTFFGLFMEVKSKTKADNIWCRTQWEIDGLVIQSEKTSSSLNLEPTRGVRLVRGRIIAHCETATPVNISILATSGAIVRQYALPAKEDFDEELDLEGLSGGLYIIRCVIGDQTVKEKIVIK